MMQNDDRLRSSEIQTIPEKAWTKLVSEQKVDTSLLRLDIANSWNRCLANKVDPLAMSKKNGVLNIYDVIEQNQNKLLLEAARPVMAKLNDAIKAEDGYIVTLSDANKVTLEIIGSKQMLNVAESLNIVAGSLCSEDSIGTTSAGVCFAEKKPARVLSHEHFVQDMHNWCCSGAPIFDDQGNLIAVLNVSNLNKRKHKPYLLNLVSSSARIIEAEMKYWTSHHIHKKTYFYLNSMLENVNEPILHFDRDGIIIHANKIAASVLGVSLENSVGKNLYQILNANYITKGRPDRDSSIQEMIVESLKGNKSFLARFVKIIGENPNESGFIGTFKEMTKHPEQPNRANFTFEDILYDSKAMQQVIQKAKRVATNDTSVFINGESGTGKEMLAQSIHNDGHRSSGPFLAINCAALHKDLIQSELFGYEEGTFTGAKKGGNPGKFELAQGGTVFLDEIGDMPLDIQTNLLRVLQEKSVVRIGGNRPIPLDVRIIAATNKDIHAEIETGRFRADLYYRLSAMTLTVPPLRERPEDIDNLFCFLMEKYGEKMNGQAPIHVNPDVKKELRQYDWPGNVRELENAVQHILNSYQNNTVTVHDLPDRLLHNLYTAKQSILQNPGLAKQSLPEMTYISDVTLDEAEKEIILNALAKCDYNIARTSSALGTARSTLYRKIKRYGISISK